jgi:hypothetical protein
VAGWEDRLHNLDMHRPARGWLPLSPGYPPGCSHSVGPDPARGWRTAVSPSEGVQACREAGENCQSKRPRAGTPTMGLSRVRDWKV